MSQRTTPAITGCTVASPAYRVGARVLAESFIEHHPDGRFVVADLGSLGPGGEEAEPMTFADERIEVIHPELLAGSRAEVERLGMAYSTQGFAGAMKPRLLRHLLNAGRSPIFLIDADICIYGDMTELAERVAGTGCLATPHLSRPLLEGEYPTMLAGVFNTGFVGIAEGAEDLLGWWVERTRRECIFRPHRGIVWEQSWLGIAPAFFPIDVLRDAGVNAMTRDLLGGGDIEWDGDRPSLRGRPLLCFHFSGPYDPLEPDYLLSIDPSDPDTVQRPPRHGPGELHWLALEARPGARRLSRQYAAKLLAAGYATANRSPAPFTDLPGAAGGHRPMRDAYRSALIRHERNGELAPPNPFSGSGTAEFIDWLAELTGGTEEEALSRFMLGLWNCNSSASGAFPDVPGPDTHAFAAWAAERLLPPAGSLPAKLDPRLPRQRRRSSIAARIRLGR